MSECALTPIRVAEFEPAVGGAVPGQGARLSQSGGHRDGGQVLQYTTNISYSSVMYSTKTDGPI